MNPVRLRCLLTALLAIMIATAPAASHTSLLRYPDVQKDMRVSAAVGKKIEAIMAAGEKRMAPIMAKAKAEHSFRAHIREIDAVGRDTDGKILALLTPAQKTRLEQLTLQSEGASALQNPSVVKKLGLTKAQVDALDKAYKQHLDNALSGLPSDPAARRIQIAQGAGARRASMKQTAQKVLTPKQWKAWLRLQGKPLPIFQ